jgi:hypothetical protein
MEEYLGLQRTVFPPNLERCDLLVWQSTSALRVRLASVRSGIGSAKSWKICHIPVFTNIVLIGTCQSQGALHYYVVGTVDYTVSIKDNNNKNNNKVEVNKLVPTSTSLVARGWQN